MQEKVTLTMKEKHRYETIKESLDGRIRVKDASMTLGLSIRQIYRLRRKVKEEGIKGVIHHSRGRQSKRRIPQTTQEKIKQLYEDKYLGFNINHFTEYLNRDEGINISREKVRQILRTSGLYTKKPKKQPKHRIRREPMPQEGLLTQLDTSEHLWIPSLGRKIYLILLIDDATNKIQHGKFVTSDSTVENMKVLEEFFLEKGLPGAFYIDKDSKFKTQRHGGIHYNVSGEEYPDTQIRRAFRELGIEVIYADSPQAKGRIERDFQTLQDRLIKELKVKGISTIAEANKYLQGEYIRRWNESFSRQARDGRLAYRDIPIGIDLRDILCIKDSRKVYPDNTISYKGRRYQIIQDRERSSYAKARVEVYEHLDGGISILYKGMKLRYVDIADLYDEGDNNLERSVLLR